MQQAIANDPDGEAIAADQNISYQWQTDASGDWEDIAGAQDFRYDTASLVVPTRTRYRLQISYRDGQGYDNTRVSAASVQIVDGDRDGLLDIYHLEDLNAVRYRFDGTALATQADDAGLAHGCPAGGCFGYELTRDLDFNDPNSYASGVVNSDWTVQNFADSTDTGWQPLGEEDMEVCDPSPNSCFPATFNGNGYTLSNLQMNRKDVSDDTNVALFAGLYPDAVIRDIGLVDARIESFSSVVGDSLRVAGLVAINEGKIINSYVQGDIAVERAIVGGISARSRGEIINSYADINMRVAENRFFLNYVGGLVGRLQSGLVINSYATGNIGGGHINTAGGLVGLSSSGRIINSYASVDFDPDIQHNFHRVGGLVGLVSTSIDGGSSLILNSYASGNITSLMDVPPTDTVSIGGLVGRVGGGENTIRNSYAAGLVAPRITITEIGRQLDDYSLFRVGGLIGQAPDARDSGDVSLETENSYWDSDATRQNDSGDGEPKQTVEMQQGRGQTTDLDTVYFEWSDDDWDFGGISQYPTLKYRRCTPTPTATQSAMHAACPDVARLSRQCFAKACRI